MINDYENEFNVNKEIIDALPKNNVKNRTKCVEEIDNLLKKYLSDKEEIFEEINIRYKEYSDYNINPELENLNKNIQEMYKTLPLLNDYTTSYEKSGLDRIFYNLDHFYKSSLDTANENIFACINIFEEVGIKLVEKDFIYSIYTLNYISEVFSERENGINSLKLKTLFDSLYWKCPDIIKQITINFKYLYFKNKKYFDNYFINKKNNLIQEKNMSAEDILNEYVDLKKKQKLLITEDKYLILNRFKNKLLDFKDYNGEQVSKNYRAILNDNVNENDAINENVLKLNDSLEEYKSYLKYKFIIDDIKNLYKEKDKYNKIAAPKKKEIEKLESKLISTSKKLNKMIFKNKNPEKIEDLTNKVNIMISQVEGLYKEYEDNLFLEHIASLNETTSIYEALETAISNYRYINGLIKKSDETLDNNAVNQMIDEINNYLYSYELSLIKNVYITDERDIAMVLIDKYNLFGFNIKTELLEEGNIDNLIATVNALANNIYFEKINANIGNMKFVFDSQDIIEKKEWSIAI